MRPRSVNNWQIWNKSFSGVNCRRRYATAHTRERNMKKTLVVVTLVLLMFGISSSQDLNVTWIHGSDPCIANKDVPFQVHAYNGDTFILRENKCINYEGPFIYLLFGQDKVFLQDTGAAHASTSGI